MRCTVSRMRARISWMSRSNASRSWGSEFRRTIDHHPAMTTAQKTWVAITPAMNQPTLGTGRLLLEAVATLTFAVRRPLASSPSADFPARAGARSIDEALTVAAVGHVSHVRRI